jgi:hypothetical protein
MHSTLLHLRLLKSGPDQLLNDTTETHQGFPLDLFPDYQILSTSRRINWPQSFARRGLNCADYRALETNSSARYEFERTNHANLAAPMRVQFERGGDPGAILQGDLLTYQETRAGFYLQQLESLGGAVREHHLRRLAEGNRGYRILWWTDADKESTQELSDAIAGDQYHAWKLMRDCWNPESDVLYLGFDASLLDISF